MESLAAIGLAANIAQFTEYIWKLVSKTYKTYQKGSANEFIELELIAEELQCRAKAINERNTSGEGPLNQLAADCISLTNELLDAVRSLKLRESGNKWGSFRQALKTVWKADDIKALQDRVDRIGNTLSQHLLVTEQRAMSEKLNTLMIENRRLKVERITEIQALANELQTGLKDVQMALSHHGSSEEPMRLILGVAEKETQFRAEFAILNMLRFPGMDDRYETVSEAHTKTFQWVFGTPADTSIPLSSFSKWLASDDKVFWVSGKPGSGKSTLMKYIYNHDQTKMKLQTWAGDERIITAYFFFWYAAKRRIQKSQEGLLRSLLYQILRQSPETIEHVFPDIRLLRDPKHGPIPPIPHLFTIPETVPGLLGLLRSACDGLKTVGRRCCFFIDGLDEYEGRPMDMVDLITTLKDMDVKLCIASRPWNEFENSFGQDSCQKLFMQDLTQDDIRNYVHSVFRADKNYLALEVSEPSAGAELVDEIVEAAQGVFLWVILVVRSLQEGLLNGDRIVDLQTRLRHIPQDLDEFFKKILFDVDELYRPQTALFFGVTVNACDQLPLIVYWFMEHVDMEAMFKMQVSPMEYPRIASCLAQTQKRLNACCKGLLEVQSIDNLREIHEAFTYFDLRVRFSHRTVKDFLDSPKTRGFLLNWNSMAFTNDATICCSVLSAIKAAPRCNIAPLLSDDVLGLHGIFMQHCKTLNDTPDLTNVLAQLLDHYGPIRVKIFPWMSNFKYPIPCLTRTEINRLSGYECFREPTFIELCAMYGIDNYVARRLDRFRDRGDSWVLPNLLYIALCRRSKHLAELILQQGVSLDDAVAVRSKGNADRGFKKGYNGWVCFLQYLFWRDKCPLIVPKPWRMDRPNDLHESAIRYFDVIQLCLEHGADPSQPVVIKVDAKEQMVTVEQALCSFLPPEHVAKLEPFFRKAGTTTGTDEKKGLVARLKAKWRRHGSRTLPS
jgi:hypothetical protein